MGTTSFRLPRQGRLPWRGLNGPTGHVEHVAWLSERALFVAGWIGAAGSSELALEIEIDGARQPARASVHSYVRFDLAAVGNALGLLARVPLGRPAPGARKLDGLAVEVKGRWYRWVPRQGIAIAPDPGPWLEAAANRLSPEVAAGVARGMQAALADALAESSAADPVLLRSAAALWRAFGSLVVANEDPRLSAVFDAVDPRRLRRDEAPPLAEIEGSSVVAPSEPFGITVEAVVATGPEQIFVRGWMWDPAEQVAALEVVAPGRGAVSLSPLERFPKPDVVDVYRGSFGLLATGQLGFWKTVAFPWARSCEPLLRARFKNGHVRWFRCPAVLLDPFRGRHMVLGSAPDPRYLTPSLLSGSIRAALATLCDGCRAVSDDAPTVAWDFRAFPAPIQVSLIIPVVCPDLLEPQLSPLADDPDVAAAEVVVVADVEGPHEIERRLFELARFYGLAVRLVAPGLDRGWTAAVEAGVRVARGEVLGLLHADTFALAPGWIGRLAGDLEEAAIVGPTLVFEDGGVSSGAISFRRDLEPDGLWAPYSAGRGRLPARAARSEEALAVSGAALFVRRRTYLEAGGLLDDYAAGDGDDLDLCLRCRERGGVVRHQPAVRLFHMGDQFRTPGPGWRRNPWASLYNRMLFTERWGDVLARAAAE